jgi:hypothetical protein
VIILLFALQNQQPACWLLNTLSYSDERKQHLWCYASLSTVTRHPQMPKTNASKSRNIYSASLVLRVVNQVLHKQKEWKGLLIVLDNIPSKQCSCTNAACSITSKTHDSKTARARTALLKYISVQVGGCVGGVGVLCGSTIS